MPESIKLIEFFTPALAEGGIVRKVLSFIRVSVSLW